MKVILSCCLLCLFLSGRIMAQGDGYILKDGKRQFVFGSYFLPKDDVMLKEMTDAGFNLFACNTKEELDRVQKFNVQGWVFLRLEKGITPELQKFVGEVAKHPALAVWSGPDEIVWNFTAHSKLYKKLNIYHTPGAWKNQTGEAVEYARKRGGEVMSNMHKSIDWLRGIDARNLQIWINEAQNSDMGYVGQYMDAVDVTGCDIYPIKISRVNGSTSPRREIRSIGREARRWTAISEHKPVWMVLQSFSWSELINVEPENAVGRPLAYPSFDESRYMAYDVLANGTTGILYWDIRYMASAECRQSLYGLAREFNALQPFLTTDPKPLKVSIYHPEEDANNHVVATARQFGRDWMVAVVNESDTSQLAAVVDGLELLNGQKLMQLYGDEEVVVRNGRMITRLRPFEVKVFATSRKWEAADKKGRDYAGK